MGYKSTKKRFEVQKGVDIQEVLSALSDVGVVSSSLPCIVARHGDKIRLRFSRLIIFRVEDTYTISIAGYDSGVKISLVGEKSSINLTFLIRGNQVEFIGEYNGPKQWIVSSCLEAMGESLYEEAISEAARVPKPTTAADYSSNLAKISWISRLLMRSILVKSEIVAVNKGGLVSYIESLASENIFSKYKTVYVSGTSDKGSFRLLFINGELVGVYALINKEERVGDDKILNSFEGFTRIRVYGSNTEPKNHLR